MENKELTEKLAAEIALDGEYRTKYKFIRKAKNVDENGVEHVAYFKAPNRLIIGMALAEIERNQTAALEYIFDDTVIRDISEVDYFRDNDAVFLGLNLMLQSLVQVKKSTFTT